MFKQENVQSKNYSTQRICSQPPGAWSFMLSFDHFISQSKFLTTISCTFGKKPTHCFLFQGFGECSLLDHTYESNSIITNSCLVSCTSGGWPSAFLFVCRSCPVVLTTYTFSFPHSTLSQSVLCWTVRNTTKWRFWPMTLKIPKHPSCRDTWS